MKKTRNKIIALGMVLILALQHSHGATAATVSTSISDFSTTQIKLYEEDLSLREQYVKHFKKDDGGYIAAIYAEPVHYQNENGLWAEINNTLCLDSSPSKSTNSSLDNQLLQHYENKSNAFKVKLPKLLTVNNAIEVSYKQSTISFRMLGNIAISQAEPMILSDKQPDKSELLKQAATLGQEDAEKQQKSLEKASTLLSNQNAGISYSNIQPNINLEYFISGQKLKESIILTAPTPQESFSFEFTYTNLTPVIQPFGAVYFFADSNKESEPIFIIEAPYMEDASEEDTLCMDITVSVTPTETGCIYTITPDEEWLRDPTRVYPIKIDPTINTPTGSSIIQDAGVNQYNPTTNYQTVDRMYVGSNLSGTTAYESRIYIRFPRASEIPTNAYISDATVLLDFYPTAAWQTASNLELEIYEVGNYNWNSGSITWNSQSAYTFSNKLDTETSNSSDGQDRFTITTLVRKWYSTTANNNGVVIKPAKKDTSKTNRTCYYSSDYSTQTVHPRIQITYYPTKTLSVPLYGQQYDKWCWAASVQMVAKYYGYTVTQRDIVFTIKDLPDNAPESTFNQGALWSETVAALNYATNSNAFSHRTTFSENTLFDKINLGHPVLLRRGTYSNSTGNRMGGHMTVVYGYTCISGVRYYFIHDPWPADDDPWPTNNPGESYMLTYAEIANQAGSTFTVKLDGIICK